MIIENARDITESKGISHELEVSRRKLEKYKLEVEELRKKDMDNEFVYKSKSMTNLMTLASRVAGINSTVLIQGESGTGKSVIAKYIHKHSAQKDGPFVAVNCAASSGRVDGIGTFWIILPAPLPGPVIKGGLDFLNWPTRGPFSLTKLLKFLCIFSLSYSMPFKKRYIIPWAVVRKRK